MLDFFNKKGQDEITYASQLPLKKITVSIFGVYRVYKNGELYHKSTYPSIAVEAYNEI